MNSIIPKKCASITKKGHRCKRQAILGEAHCKIHAKPSPGDAPSVFKSLAKIGGGLLLESLVKGGVKAVIEYYQNHTFFRNGPVPVLRRHNTVTFEEFERWYAGLDSEAQKKIVELARTLNPQSLSVGGTA